MKKLLLLGAALALAGCATLARQVLQNPVVNLRDVNVRGIGLTGGSLDVILSVYNPNNFRLDATRMTYRLFVGDSLSLANGEITTLTTVQATDSTILSVPVSFTYAGLGAAARQIFNTGSVNYRVAGEVTVGAAGIRDITVPYSSTGRFDTLR
jgi:LEA14-like dessication related protein